MTRARLTIVSAALAAALAAACASAPRPGPGGDGQALYRARCASCHRLYAPGDRTRREWTALLERMAPRAHLSDVEREAVQRYLDANAKDAVGAR